MKGRAGTEVCNANQADRRDLFSSYGAAEATVSVWGESAAQLIDQWRRG